MDNESELKERLVSEFPYEVHLVRGPNGEEVWIQKGINPDNIFGDKRKSEWPFSQTIADLICQRIAEGESLARVCKIQGLPSYNVVCRWRRENPDFEKDLNSAYRDRSEFYLEQVLSTLENLDPTELTSAQLKIRVLRWCAESVGQEKKAKSGVLEIKVKSV